MLNVGDTRIYQFRDHQVIFQSFDHSIAQIAVLSGEITKDEIRTYPHRNRLIRALGAEKTVKAELSVLDVRPGDSFLLCSDGLWEPVTEKTMVNTLDASATPKDWLAKLQALVEQDISSNKDNHSGVAVMIKLGATEQKH